MSVDVIAEKPAALKLFLIDRRCRPASVGLPTRSRRNPGLTRQQSPNCSTFLHCGTLFFESGTCGRRFSYDFLVRLVAALKLDDDDREMLSSLR
jgi:hypothetical protein